MAEPTKQEWKGIRGFAAKLVHLTETHQDKHIRKTLIEAELQKTMKPLLDAAEGMTSSSATLLEENRLGRELDKWR